MQKENKSIVNEIDLFIRKHSWFDFHVIKYDYFQLVVGGNYDLTYYHSLEIIFEDVSFVFCNFSGWRSDTENRVFQIPDNEPELINKYEIEKGYQLFMFKAEDLKNDIIVAAKKISYNTDTVYYHNRPNLGLNERMADFVNRE